VEVKARKAFALERWLPEGGLLILKPDRWPPLAMLPLEALLWLTGGRGVRRTVLPLLWGWTMRFPRGWGGP